MTTALEKVSLTGLPEEIVALNIQREDLSSDVLFRLNEIRLAKEAGLNNQIEAHGVKLRAALVKKRVGKLGAQMVDAVTKHSDHMRLQLTCNLGHSHSIDVEPEGKDIDKYPDLIPMDAIDNVLEIKKRGIFDEIKIHPVWEDPDPVVIGRIGKVLFLLGQWE